MPIRFTGAVSLNTTGASGHATIDNGTTALDIAASSVGGRLTLRSGNSITDSGTVTVGNFLTVTTDANNGMINLDTLAVSSHGILLSTHGTGNATLVNNAGLMTRNGSAVGGNLSATAITGNITQWGALSVTGHLLIHNER